MSGLPQKAHDPVPCVVGLLLSVIRWDPDMEMDMPRAAKNPTPTKREMAKKLRRGAAEDQVLNLEEEVFVDLVVENHGNLLAVSRILKTSYQPVLLRSKKPHIRAAISSYLLQYGSRPDEVLNRISMISRADVGELLETDGRGRVQFNLPKAIQEKRTGQIKALQITNDEKTGIQSVRVEMHNALDALKLLSKIHGMTPEDARARQMSSEDIIAALRGEKANGPSLPASNTIEGEFKIEEEEAEEETGGDDEPSPFD